MLVSEPETERCLRVCGGPGVRLSGLHFGIDSVYYLVPVT